MNSKTILFLISTIIIYSIFFSFHTKIVQGKKHVFNQGDEIPVYIRKLGPRVNPTETYPYFFLPFCSRLPVERKSQSLGEILEGGRKVNSGYTLKFIENMNTVPYCDRFLDDEHLERFKEAIERDFEIHMEIDGLPFKGKIGQVVENPTLSGPLKSYILFTNYHFEIKYNEDRIIEINMLPAEKGEELNIDSEKKSYLKIEFTYSVTWIPTDIPFHKRMDKFNQLQFLSEEIEIQWFSIINSVVLVILLTGFLVFIILRILKKDYQRYEEEDEDQETGWKLLHGEVFRFPSGITLLSSILGSGSQLLTLSFFMLSLALIGVFYKYSRGTVFTTLIVVYALVSGISGYVSGSFYKQLGGKNWINNVLLTIFLFVGPVFLVWSFLNTVAIVYRSSAALPFGTILGLLAIHFLLTFPLTLLGAIAGKNFSSDFDRPCRPKNAVRLIPPAPWYRGTFAQFLVAGFLPFSAIYVELYYAFISLWGTQLYTPYDILFIVFVILIIVTACITVALTYLQLSMEDHSWWWRSLVCGGSTAFFIFAYCIFFLYFESSMEGFLQHSFYYGYMFTICYAFFLMLGTVGFASSLSFVRHIYKSIRVD